MSILVNKSTRVVVQGITGKEGSFHATQCQAYGTHIVAGVTPGKAGQEIEGIPVFDTVRAAVQRDGSHHVVDLRASSVRCRCHSRGGQRGNLVGGVHHGRDSHQ